MEGGAKNITSENPSLENRIMKAKITRIPHGYTEIEFNSPTSVLDLCLKAKLIDSDLLSSCSEFLLRNEDGERGLSSDFNQLVNDGDRIAIRSGAK